MHKMTKDMIPFSERTLNEFAANEWAKTNAYLHNQFGLDDDDCKDVFQEAFLTLYDSVRQGRMPELTSSLSTFFTGICRNKALELLRANARYTSLNRRDDGPLTNACLLEDKARAIADSFDTDADSDERREAVVRQIVRELPPPCNQLLWGFYRDNLTMKTLAAMFNYSVGSVKVIKHRCMEKFRLRYRQLADRLLKG